MSDQVPATECEGRAHVLDKCVESFLTKLSGLGYATATMRQKRAMVEYFARWVVHRRFDIAEIDERVVGAFHVHLGRRRIPMGNWRCTTKTFLEHLRGEALTARPEETVRDDSREGHLLQRYDTYLREERGLARETVCNYLRFVSGFARKHFTSSATGEYAPGPGFQEIRDYLLASTRVLAPRTAQLVATALRSFLRFLFLRGETPVDLAPAIPLVRGWRQVSVHPYLSPEEVERLLATCDGTTSAGRRDHAILLLLARLGVRACEVAAMQIADLRWRTGEILIRGKGLVHQRLPMLPDVGAAVALYLRDDRPKSSCRSVFLRNDAPRTELSADAVGSIVRRALVRAGLHPPRRGSHLLRFSLATNMIQTGATMTEIGEVLRHRSPETTEIYAKVDFEALRAVALPWTGLGGAL